MALDYAQRLQAIRAGMEARGVELLFLSPGTNLEYALGVKRHKPNFGNVVYPGGWLNGAFVGLLHGPILVVPRMVADFDMAPVPGLETRVLADRDDAMALLRRVLAEFPVGRRRIAVEDRVWGSFVLSLLHAVPDARLSVASEIIAPLRMIKTEEEIGLMRRAGEIVDAAMGELLAKLRPGVTELEMLTEVDYQLARLGSEAPSFVSAVYAMNPARPRLVRESKGDTSRPIDAGTCVAFDFGAVHAGYCSDFGRTVFVGDPPPAYLETFELVMAAQAAGIAAMHAGGVTAEAVDAAARRRIVDAGFGAAFRHRLGHGIGMDVHEPPFLDKGDATPLREGMAFTVEPSIIEEGRWFVRVEDVVVARPTGGEPLSNFSRRPLVG
jgi:Xaa-Pro aminopeptidase